MSELETFAVALDVLTAERNEAATRAAQHEETIHLIAASAKMELLALRESVTAARALVAAATTELDHALELSNVACARGDDLDAALDHVRAALTYAESLAEQHGPAFAFRWLTKAIRGAT